MLFRILGNINPNIQESKHLTNYILARTNLIELASKQDTMLFQNFWSTRFLVSKESNSFIRGHCFFVILNKGCPSILANSSTTFGLRKIGNSNQIQQIQVK